ncbi:MAG: hypothetical protein WC421_00950 [Elusimicrobiales bacterium]
MPEEEDKKPSAPPDLGGVFERLAKTPPPQDAPRREARKVHEDRTSVRALRDNLSGYQWAQGEVYRLSAKYFGKRTAAELDEQCQRLLKSLHYMESPEENADLAINTLLDRMTSAEAMKASLARKSMAELKKAFADAGWPQDRAARIAAKYAGERSAAEIEARCRIILSELPHDQSPSENRDLALDVLEDAGSYEAARAQAARRVWLRQTARLLDAPPQLAEKLADAFPGKKTPQELLAECEALTARIKCGQYPKDFLPAIAVLLGETAEGDAMRHARAQKNRDDVNRLACELSLTQKQAARIAAAFAAPESEKWFDERFLELFESLPQYADSDRENALLAARVLAGELNEKEALSRARGHKNHQDALELAKELALPQEQAAKLLEFAGGENAPPLRGGRYDELLIHLPQPPDRPRFAGRLALRAFMGEISEDSARRAAELAVAFAKYSIAENDLCALERKYGGQKSAQELTAEFEAVLAKLDWQQSPEENYGLALAALLEPGGQSGDAAASAAREDKERARFQAALNGYGWFSGYASELCGKFFGHKDVNQLISSFEKIISALPHQGKAEEENRDLALRVLLERVSSSEAVREAELRKLFRGAPWSYDYAADLAGAYLGDLLPMEIFGYLNDRFSASGFWRDNQPAHRYIMAKTAEYLAGRMDGGVYDMVFELLALSVPPRAVREVEQAAANYSGRRFDPREMAKRYAEAAAKAGGHDGAAKTAEEIFAAAL